MGLTDRLASAGFHLSAPRICFSRVTPRQHRGRLFNSWLLMAGGPHTHARERTFKTGHLQTPALHNILHNDSPFQKGKEAARLEANTVWTRPTEEIERVDWDVFIKLGVMSFVQYKSVFDSWVTKDTTSWVSVDVIFPSRSQMMEYELQVFNSSCYLFGCNRDASSVKCQICSLAKVTRQTLVF